MTGTGRSIRIFAVACAALATLAACGSDSKAASDTAAPTTTAGSAGSTPGTGSTAGTTPCAPADGSAKKQQIFTAGPPMCLQNGKGYVATITTNHGVLHVTLRPDIAPITVNSFVNLARYHYFDGTTCHRAIKNFVVQCGDPTATGTGGPGYSFKDELTKIEPYRIGSVAMANSGPDTNGSQFFIITGTQGTALPPNYTLFGGVNNEDLGVVASLDQLGNPADGPPLQPIDITSITIEEK